MNILAVDTASRSCSVAVVCDETVLSELTVVTPETHSRHIMGMIDDAVSRAGLQLQDLDGLAVTHGPGSFTGLRIGVSTMKGISKAIGKPLVGVSSLDALAASVSLAGIPVCCMLDARRSEVYYAWYHPEEGVLKKTQAEQAAAPVSIVSGIQESCLFVGDGAVVYREVIETALPTGARFAEPPGNNIQASHVAFLGMVELQAADYSQKLVSPFYLRKCDAEINQGKNR